MIGIRTLAKGRMGNRLFHYHFLRQIAKQTGVRYFHPRLPDSPFFDGMEKQTKPFSFFKKKIHLTSKEILQYTPSELVNAIAQYDTQGFDVLLDPPMLGEVFFDYTQFPPRDFINVKHAFKIPFAFEANGKTVVGLHFRGTDFKTWNKHASLAPDYYIQAIDFCRAQLKNESLVFVLFTDDVLFETYVVVKNYLQSLGANVQLNETKRTAIYDFYQLSMCDIIISSPSTFAIWAGCVGKAKKIIHSKQWLAYAAGRDDTFWKKLVAGGNQFYSLWHAC